MINQDQTFSINSLPYKEMFDRLATSANTRLARAGKSNQSEMEFERCRGIFSAVIRKKAFDV